MRDACLMDGSTRQKRRQTSSAVSRKASQSTIEDERTTSRLLASEFGSLIGFSSVRAPAEMKFGFQALRLSYNKSK